VHPSDEADSPQAQDGLEQLLEETAMMLIIIQCASILAPLLLLSAGFAFVEIQRISHDDVAV